VSPLRQAVRRLRALRVDHLVTLGDAFDTVRHDQPGAEVARILAAEEAIGVWGNHDLGVSHDVSEHMRGLADPDLLAFASRLGGQLVLENHRFSHVLPWRDAHVIENLWTFDDLRDGVEPRRCFNAVPERVLFVGHYHSWGVMKEGGETDWGGDEPIALTHPECFLVRVAAVCDGWFAHFDTETTVLTPLRCDESPSVC